jgi:hypothetical protein
MVVTFWISCFKFFCCMHLLKSLYFLFIGRLLCFFFFFLDKIHGLSFHFYLYNVREENTFYFENFEKSFFFVYCNFVVIIIIPNTCRNLPSLVVHNNAEPKFLERETCGLTNIWLWKKENVFHLYWVSFQKYLCSRKRHLDVPKGMSIF